MKDGRKLLAAALAVVLGVAGFIAADRGVAEAAADPFVFTSGDVGFSEGANPTGLENRLDAMDAFVGERKPMLRLDLDWWYVQECRECALRWDRLDPIVDAAHARGIRVLIILAYGAPWANGGRSVEGRWLPAEDAAWAGIVAATVAHFGDKVQAYEVWNEPNFARYADYGDGSVEARMRRYWQLVKIAHAQVHDKCAKCVVLAGGSGAGDPVSEQRNDNESAKWLQWGYTNGYRGYFDAVTHHPYPAWNAGFGPSRPECATRWWAMFGPPDPACGELAAVRKVMVDNGDAAKKIWATEFGNPSVGVPATTARVRDALEEGIRNWRTLDYAGPLFLFSYRDQTYCTDAQDPECHFGMTTANGTPKQPMYDGVKAALTEAWVETLKPGRSLHRGSALRATNGGYHLWLQGDGNLVLYRQQTPLWVRGDLKGFRLTSQTDGDLVLFDRNGAVLWRSGTTGRGANEMIMQNDGNLVIYPNGGPYTPATARWATGTYQR